MTKTIFTIGHSTHLIEEFIGILKVYGVEQLIDVRTIPRSRHNPQFNLEDLTVSLQDRNIKYIHLVGLGGLRKTAKDSVNMAWRNLSFRGFADYMQTPEFSKAMEELVELVETSPSAIMCAETVPWHCHRSLIGDALLIRNFKVEDIFNESKSRPHKLTPWAEVVGTQITYPGSTEGDNGEARDGLN